MAMLVLTGLAIFLFLLFLLLFQSLLGWQILIRFVGKIRHANVNNRGFPSSSADNLSLLSFAISAEDFSLSCFDTGLLPFEITS